MVAPEISTLVLYHWYAGVDPPKLGVAVKVTGVFLHIGLSETAMETDTGKDDPMIMLIWLDVAGLPLTQFSLEVTWHDTRSPFKGV